MFLKIGHRGAGAYEIENTINSFLKAIELGANAVELDVRKSRDGNLVICHDDNLKRVFGRILQIHETTLAELKNATDNKMITLSEALQGIGEKANNILLEMKEPGSEKLILDTVRKNSQKERVIIASFHQDALAAVRRLDKKIETGLIYTRFRNPIEAADRLGASYLLPLYRFTHTKDIQKAHKNDLKVIVWTINTKEEAQAFIAKGVDGIATDRPDIFREIT